MDKKKVHLNVSEFDDGPSLYTYQILDILGVYNIKATFFVGEAVKKYPEIIESMYKEKHVIGNHTWDHQSIIEITPLDLSNQILKTNSVIKDILEEEPTIFRPPYGSINNTAYNVIHCVCLFVFFQDILKKLDQLLQCDSPIKLVYFITKIIKKTAERTLFRMAAILPRKNDTSSKNNGCMTNE